ncbi:class I SAM-dependent methyltransferase [Actinospica robiniae]|uniref:class I SAM-dependent methyltransferase n=1 Tax=Actinospica robiniae TaxID=304901 RepID=UPI00041E878F|nr:class I SAM-dependent methyltransferase [Actinospica robiniae]
MSAATSDLSRDPYGDRRRTSHERLAGQPWEASYLGEPAPWDIGRPQPAVARVVADGGFTGTVLDVGCGTGENSLHIAATGLDVLGVDVAPTALAIARAKSEARGIPARFATADAFRLQRLGSTFDTVLDCGLFHTFDEDERRDYVASLALVTAPEGTLHVLCFSDEGPEPGPHPVGRAEFDVSFNAESGWRIEALESTRIQTRFHGEDGAPAWLATIERIA